MVDFFGSIRFPQSSGSIFTSGPLELRDNIVEIPIPLSQQGQPRLDTQNKSIVGGINENRALINILQGQVNVSGLEDVDINSIPNDGDVLAYNKDISLWIASGTVKSFNGQQGNVVVDLVETLDELSDVNSSTAQNSEVLVFNGINWEPSGITITGGSGGSTVSPVDARPVSGNIIPDTSGVYNLGSTNHTFNDIYADDLHVFKNVRISGTFWSDARQLFPSIRAQRFLHLGGEATFFNESNNNFCLTVVDNPNVTTFAVMDIRAQSTAYSANICNFACATAATTGYSFWDAASSAGIADDIEFRARGNGDLLLDGTTSSPAADYAEYFESVDPSGISVGYLVQLTTSGMIEPATSADNAIGVISARPSIIGNGAPLKWHARYLKDDFGAYLLDASGYRIENPVWNSGLKYVPRELRPEWNPVGLIGQLCARTCETTSGNYVTLGESGMLKNWTGEDIKWRVITHEMPFNTSKGYGVVKILFK